MLTNSNLTYTELRNAGSATLPALDIEAAILVDNLTLSDNQGGLQMSQAGFKAGSKNLTIRTTTAGKPLTVHPDALIGLPMGGTLTGNTTDLIAINGNAMTRSGTINDLGIPYYVTGELRIMGGTSLTIAPGTDFVMGADSGITLGWNSGSASLIATGTAALPITFVGVDVATPGYWNGIILESNVLSTTRFDYVTIGNAGGTYAALDLLFSLPAANFTYCTITKFALAGIRKRTANANDYTLNGNMFTMPAAAAMNVVSY